MGKVYDITVHLTTLVYFITFVISLKSFRNKGLPDYMKGFYWYPMVGFIMCGLLELKLLVIFPKIYVVEINLVSQLFHFLFLSFFISRVINDNKYRILIKLISLCFLTVLMPLMGYDIIKNTNKSFAVVNFLLLLFCIYYYYSLFKRIPTLNLLNEPAFWVVTGIVVGVGVSIPSIIFKDYIRSNAPFLYFTCSLISNVFYLLMYGFFIKAFICKIPTCKKL